MIRGFARTDRSMVAQWWWTVDRWMLAAVIALAFIGAILVLAASPAVATRIGMDSFALVRRHYAMLPLALGTVIFVSMLSAKQVRRLGVILFFVFFGLTALTLFAGVEIKGATRWISLGPLSLQPSEFLKPCFAIFAAWMFALQKTSPNIPGNIIAIGAYLATIALLLKQPDLGMTAVVTATWAAQFFIAGLPIFWVLLLVGLGAAGLVGAYFALPHVTERVDQFFNPESGDTYQIDRALEAFQNGGLYGKGPGEGSVKLVLPDAHADFVFAVAGEEFGLIVCLILVALFAFIVLRALSRLLGEHNHFIILAATGLVTSFGLQAIVNMASTLHLMPTKGMTLPFISYGGSSIIAIGLGVGMLLALTRRRFPGSVEP
ncbi:FtsW/RodA/SpoVE family cell cycle protein [Dongia rigui]|uniref:Probable peptidoglycan glycosyltransferase FtsW n=1 Tax=Dongia rigui TaxID=940149 RepID=A0ABU5DW13_9PROT|nr:putative peptidoglycan glycosyltransferase FtsW [Dongia rigui]MDY0871130.1 putative peptidoglycan glycosyltransferase FtsW [Dongia rigui]